MAEPTGRPLEGRRIAVTRPAAQSAALVAAIRAHGGEPLVLPAIAIAPPRDLDLLDAALDGMASWEWVAFTSTNAARALRDRLRQRDRDEALPAAVRLAAVGPATAEAVRECFRAPDLVATTPDAASLAAELPVARGTRVLFPCAEEALDTLPAALRARGALVDVIVAYRTVPAPGAAELAARVVAGEVDAIVLASGSAARATAGAVREALAQEAPARSGTARPLAAALPPLVCIGRTTADAVEALGLAPAAVARTPDAAGLAEALVRALASGGAHDRRGGERR